MSRSHALTYFTRVYVADSIRAHLTGGYLVNAISNPEIFQSPRYLRLCRITAQYRTSAYI
jgi:hypothetical protein